MSILAGEYCKIKADVVILVQDSKEISQITIQSLKSILRRLLSVLDSDATVTYNFALAMYARRHKISSFGSKEETITYMNGEFNKGKSGRNLGNQNVLKRTLKNIIKKTFKSRPKDRKKVSSSSNVVVAVSFFLYFPFASEQKFGKILQRIL